MGRNSGLPMEAKDYDEWYQTSRGQWIGKTEYALLKQLLMPHEKESLLDVGCGTGYFTRLFARDLHGQVTGIDLNHSWLAYAKAHSVASEDYVEGAAESLPFGDNSSDLTISVTALCFIKDQRQAVCEILRVTRRRFAIGLLNRHSLLYFQKGRSGGKGGYRGAYWHTASEIRTLFARMPVVDVKVRTAVYFPKGRFLARLLEMLLPGWLRWGGFIVVSGTKSQPHDKSRGALLND